MTNEPSPKRNILKAGVFSMMNFMPEQLAYDKELGTLVRWRSMFEMPNWDGVEAEETTYIIDDPEDRLDKIAARFWGNDRMGLYWVIAARNNLDLPDVQLYKGKRLKIPSRGWIDTKMLPQAQKYVERR
jgi:hypothetical protein